MELRLLTKILIAFLYAILIMGPSVYGERHRNKLFNKGNGFRVNYTVIDADFGVHYNESLNQSGGYVFGYKHNNSEGSVVRVTTSLRGRQRDSKRFPLQIVVRQQLAVQSWNLPLEINDGIQFHTVSRTLCSIGQDVNTTLPIVIEATTFSNSSVGLTVYAELITNFTLSIGHHYSILVTPSSPAYYQYTFDNRRDFRSVTLYVSSPENYYCTMVSIQNAECPVQDLIQNTVAEDTTYQTFLEKAAIIIEKKENSNSVYIVFIVYPSDEICANIERITPIGETRVKHIDFWIEGHIDDTVYIFALLAAAGYCALFYVCTLLTWAVNKFWERRQASRDVELSSTEQLNNDGGDIRSYGATNDDVPGSSVEESNDFLADADTLDDINEMKGVFRLKKNLMVSDMTKKDFSKLRKKYMLYQWNIVVIAIFYALPVVQLVLTYQGYLNNSGDEDTCYYNFLCSRKLGVLHSFNNVISNVGYMTLGVLFMAITYMRHRHSKSLSPEVRDNFGIPQHFGLFYAMGWALIVEGVMSGSYHVCPSYNNFQFDTAFMYIIGGLLMLRLFQSRHPDINANAHTAYLSLSFIIFIAVIGVLFNTAAFWYIFTVFYVLVAFYMSLQIYYVGRFKFDRSLIRELILYVKSDCCKCVAPVYRARFGLLAVLNVINWALALFGAITKPKDFATFMLAIVIMNLIGYCVFYLVMKLVNKEKILPPSIIFGVVAVILWGFALDFFTHNLTNWQITPAGSRNLNDDCLILNFFDKHDAWHFLSAGAMFCSFLVIFFMDDDLREVPRNEIPVF